jgi:hypothetical protein
MNIWETLLLVLIFGFFFCCLVSAVASIGSHKQNPNRPDGEAELASFLSVLVLCLLVGVLLGTQSEQELIVAEEAAEPEAPPTTEESTTEESTKQPPVVPEEPPQQAPTDPEGV